MGGAHTHVRKGTDIWAFVNIHEEGTHYLYKTAVDMCPGNTFPEHIFTLQGNKWWFGTTGEQVVVWDTLW